MRNKKSNYGFTLIELLAVIVILGLLIGIAFPAVSSYINESKEDTYNLHEADMKTAASNMMSQCVQNGTEGCVPSNGESRTVYLSQLIDEKYSEVIRDPEDTDLYCDAEKSYVVVTNSNNNVVELDYQVCLVCSQYRSEACGEVPPTNKCDKEIDPTEPECGESVGSSTIWTNKDRVVSIPCIDNEGGCGCSQSTFYKTFTEDGKTGTITISDKAGNTKECTVNTYIDKEAPTCEIEVVDYDKYSSSTGWYGGSAPVIKITSKTDELSGVATYGIGTSKNNHDFNKLEEYKANAGISMIYGYVKDNAGNVGTCYVEVKYDSVIPTGELNYGYQVYPKDDISTKSGSTITLNTITGEFGKILGIKVYLSSNSTGMSSTTVKNGSNTLATRTISSGVTEMLYMFSEADVYNNLTIDMGSSTNVNKVEKIEIITDHVMTSSTKFYTNQDVKVYIISKDSLSGKALYSFDDGESWQTSNSKDFVTNTDLELVIQDTAGNNSDTIYGEINNIDKTNPVDATFNKNGDTYTISVGQTQLSVSTKITVDDSAATSSYAKSGVRDVYYKWTTNTTQPTTWTKTSNGSSLSQTSTGGSNYLWIKTIDKAGNETITRSNDFNVGYQITYNCNGGSGCPADQRKGYNTTLKLSSTKPTRSGYEFLGWGTTAATHTVTYASGANYTANAADELFAIWRKTLTFTFNGNGATLSATSKYCYIYNAETNCNITLPTITRSGFTIEGFNTSASATSETSGWTSGATVSVSTSTTKTWYAITYRVITITFNKNNASSIGKTSDTCTIRNSATTCSITAPSITAPTNTPTVVGWNTSSSSTTSDWNVNASKSFSENDTWYAITKKNAVTLTAKWNANNATLSSTANKTCTLAATYNGTAQSTSCTVDAPTITAPTNTPTIVGFNTSSSSTTNSSSYNTSTKKLTVTTSNNNSTWYAITKKAKVTRTLTYNGNGNTGGSTSTSSCEIAESYNGKAQSTSCSVSLRSNGFSKTGHSFSGWGTSSSATSVKAAGTSVSLSSNTTYYAIWSPYVCTMTFSPNGGSFGSNASNTVHTLKYGESTSGTFWNANGGTYSASRTGYHITGSSAWIISGTSTTIDETKDYAATSICSNLGSGNQSVTLNVNWVANVCTITFDPNGGSFGSNASNTVQKMNYGTSTSGTFWNANGGTYSASRSGYTIPSSSAWINTSNSKTYDETKDYSATDVCPSLGSGNQSVTLKVNWQVSEVPFSGSSCPSDEDLFGSAQSTTYGGSAYAYANYGAWVTGISSYYCYASNGCYRTVGYHRICYTDACGGWKGKTADYMLDNGAFANCSGYSRWWCECYRWG